MPKETHTSNSVIGPDGLPIKYSLLTEEQAAPTTTGVRSPWVTGLAENLDPAKLAKLLKAADAGDNQDFLTLAEEMEERDGHYSAVLGQRKRAVSGIEPVVTPASDDQFDKDVSASVEDLIASPLFPDMVDDLLDGIAKGYSVVENIWQYGDKTWWPEDYLHRDPRHFQFDKETGRELRLRDDEDAEGKPLTPWTMIVHRPKLKSGLPVRGGLARIVAWSLMLKTYTLNDWAAFLEVFGMPLRLGKYDGQASDKEKRVLLRAVRDLGADAAAIIPKSMEVDFIECSGGKGTAVFAEMANFLDKQISKAVIGQTMTVDDGSSRSQSETHDNVRGDIKKADARQLATTINRDLIAPYVAFNFGVDVKPPVVSFPVEDPEDLKALSDNLSKLVPLGLRVARADVNKRMGFRVPEDDEPVLQIAPAVAATSEKAHACVNCGERHRASATQMDEDPLVHEALEHWEQDMTPIVAGVIELARASSGFDDFLARLDEHTPDVSRLGQRLAISMMKAKGDGLSDA
ncbi:DUF935 domain-containing protein [Halocynthiibacter styelae]|uniref:DUF935 domain-containing protein n=1 Tax=Halocynthiibacter styelae TaxID=2761955 RepID=A0A8J7LRB6_9RHOB|nr:DUF935 domain-containing protein [Paenihalocynthiibacter styelae]MBI1495392.1 DUF935 domain-containing protein [Paenihalocynthiibacter styelae]